MLAQQHLTPPAKWFFASAVCLFSLCVFCQTNWWSLVMVPRGGGLNFYNQPRSWNRLVGLQRELAVRWNLGQINRNWFIVFHAEMATVWAEWVLTCDREAGAAADRSSVLVNPLIVVLSSVSKNTYVQHTWLLMLFILKSHWQPL